MGYMERNRALLAELSGVHLRKGSLIGEGGSAKFYSLGSFRSQSLGSDVYAGMKELNDAIDATYHIRMVHELAFIQRLENYLPNLVPELPSFYGLLQRNDSCLGIIMEDFSQGGKYEIVEAAASQIPRDIEAILLDPLTDYELCKYVFFVEGRRCFGDFFLSSVSSNEFQNLMKVIDDLTIRIDYPI